MGLFKQILNENTKISNKESQDNYKIEYDKGAKNFIKIYVKYLDDVNSYLHKNEYGIKKEIFLNKVIEDFGSQRKWHIFPTIYIMQNGEVFYTYIDGFKTIYVRSVKYDENTKEINYIMKNE